MLLVTSKTQCIRCAWPVFFNPPAEGIVDVVVAFTMVQLFNTHSGQAVASIILKPVLFAVFVGQGGEVSVGVVAEAIDAGMHQSALVTAVAGGEAGRISIALQLAGSVVLVVVYFIKKIN